MRRRERLAVSGEWDTSPGFTLMEAIVVLTILSVMAGVSGLALGSLTPPPESAGVGALRRARAEAIRTGRLVATAHRSPLTSHALFLPDGSARGPGVDPLTGAPRATR